MRIVTWNCQMGLDKKADALLSLNPDVAVVPECSKQSTLHLCERSCKTLWFGSNPHKGLGVICRNDWDSREIQPPTDKDHKWIVPVEVLAPTPFTLLAVWACRAGMRKADNYIGQVHRAITSHHEWFGRGPVVVAGDLNSNTIWDSERPVGNHSDVVKFLEERGLVSVYHEYFDEPQGRESRPTLYLYRRHDKPFHLDYIFVPRAWTRGLHLVEVGEFGKWSKLSDHCPLLVEVAC
jgi:exodeoxyribonuclease-3